MQHRGGGIVLSFVELLMNWVAGWNASGRAAPSARAELGDLDVEKQAARLVVEGDRVSGQLTVWESGECELEAYRVDDGAPVLLEHRELSSLEDLERACRVIVVACGWTAE